MRGPTPSCFRGVAGATPPATTAAGPALTTSVYETRLGVAALTWSRTVLGLSLRADLRLPCPSSFCSASSSVSSSAVSSSDSGFDAFSFRFRPWILWKRRGTRRFHIKDKDHRQQRRIVDFAWDLSCAAFPAAGGAEPASGFFVAVAVDGEMFVIVGDVPEEDAYEKIKAKKPISYVPSSFARGGPGSPTLVSRSEHVFLPDSAAGRPYTTNAKMGGKQREISIELGGGWEKDSKLCVGLDGKRVLQVKRLRWKFRGNERISVDPSSGGRCGINVTWNVHNWFFNSAAGVGTGNSAETCHATLVFRFERSEAEEGRLWKIGGGPWETYGLSHFGNGDRILSGGSSVSGGGGVRRRKRSLRKTSSFSSSTSTASSGSSSSVLAWASTEENELKESDGFMLVVYIWRR